MLSDANICVVLYYCVYAGISSLFKMPLQLLNGRSGAKYTDIKMLKRAAVEHNFGKNNRHVLHVLKRYFRHYEERIG